MEILWGILSALGVAIMSYAISMAVFESRHRRAHGMGFDEPARKR